MTRRQSQLRALVLPQLVAIDKKTAAMIKHVKAAKSVPSLPPRYPSLSGCANSGLNGRGSSAFPTQSRLIVTTTKGVYTWDVFGINEIFRSGTEGIVAAKKLVSNKEMLAVADSQVVVLHEIKGGTQRSYRLKGSENRIGLLKYAKDSDNLFFTTTLQNSVQSYSLKESTLSDTSHNHPTPPSVFAISCNSQFLLSTSSAPPTIHLTDLSLSMLPILIRPECSSSSVVAAAFHPELVNYFLLAFADGTAALLDAMHFFRKHDKTEHGARAAVSGAGGILAFIKGLHAHGTSVGKEALESFQSSNALDLGIGSVGFGDRSWGVTAVAFVPRRKATVITVGGDGKCCVIDFTSSTKQKAILLRTWHLRQPATSLSVICSIQNPLSQLDGTVEAPSGSALESSNDAYYVAIGRQDGRVLLFDLSGRPLGEQTLGDGGTPIVDVEWEQVEEGELVPTLPRRSSIPATSRDVRLTRKALGTTIPSKPHSLQSEATFTSSELDGEPGDIVLGFSPPKHLLRAQCSSEPIEAPNHLDLVHPVTISSEEVSINGVSSPRSTPYTPTTPSSKRVHRNTFLNSAKSRSYSTSDSTSVENGSRPNIPPRPKPRPGGLLSMRRAQSSHEALADDSYPASIANARRAKSTLESQTKGRFGPRPMPSRVGDRSKNEVAASRIRQDSGRFKGIALDVPPIPPLHGPPGQPRSPTPSVESFQTASSQVRSSEDSADSTETVIDWDIGSTRQPFPSLQEQFQSAKETSRLGTKQKGHISLSNSSAPRDTATPSSLSLVEASSAIVDWPEASPRYAAPGLHASLRPTESVTRLKPKANGHTSIPVASTPDDTITPISSTSSGAVVQWPSLKKSPRIPELNKAITLSARESTNGLILETYVGSPSSPKFPHSQPHHQADSVLLERRTKVYPGSVETALNASLSDFRSEMNRRFEEQRTWLENLIKGEDEGRMMLEEENRWLRGELARLEERKDTSSSA